MANHDKSREESQYHKLFEGAPVGIWDEDFSEVKALLQDIIPGGAETVRQHLQANPDVLAEAIGRVRVRHVNRMAREFYGADAEEVLIDAFPKLFDSASAKVFIDEIAAFAGGASMFSAELMATTLSGARRLVLMNVSLLPTDADDWSEVVVAFTDLTERRRLEQSLQRANELLRRVNSDLEQFAYATAHDLREPLRTIGLYAQLIQRLQPERWGPAANTALDYILQDSLRMETLVRDLLTFAQTIEPHEQTDSLMVDPYAVAHEVLTGIAGAIEQARARVVVSQGLPGAPIESGHLHQLFQNLIVNAIKYRSPDRPPEIAVTGSEQPGQVVFCVSDNGIGIRSDYHQRIFGVFKRLHNTDISGNGIGLALCKKIVEQYEGSIWVDSEVDAGSRFYFAIPKPSNGSPSNA